jgi:hypothetical protein
MFDYKRTARLGYTGRTPRAHNAPTPGGDCEEFYMSELSSDDIVAIVGPIGAAAVAEIIGTGISKAELVAAHKRP